MFFAVGLLYFQINSVNKYLLKACCVFFFQKGSYFINLFVYGCVGAFSSCVERGLLFVAVHKLLIAVASLVAEHRL